MGNWWGTVETVADFIFGGSKITADGNCSHEIKRRLLLGRKVMTNLDIIFKSRDITLPTKVCLVKAMVIPVVMCGLWWKLSTEELMLLNCGVGEDSWESLPLDCKEIQPVHSEGDQPWDYFGRNDAKAETPVLWPPHGKSWLIGKDCDAGRDWQQEEKGTTEDEMAGWHHWLNGPESEWNLGVGDGQGGLACCDSWCRKESDTTERLNRTVPGGMFSKQSQSPVHLFPIWWTAAHWTSLSFAVSWSLLKFLSVESVMLSNPSLLLLFK